MELGVIVMWSGAIVNIPGGFRLCDGTHGTPDLRDRFIVGAGTTFNPDDSGGASTHTHNFTGDGHAHTIGAGIIIATGANIDAATSSENVTGTTDAESSLPPYYALAFIQRAN